MKELVEKLRALEKEIASQKGDFSLFALFLREEAQDKWDLVISAPWLGTDRKEILDFLAKELRSRLTEDELLMISRIVLVDEGDAALEAIRRALHVEHEPAEIRDSSFFGLQIRHAFIITSKLGGKPHAGRTTEDI